MPDTVERGGAGTYPAACVYGGDEEAGLIDEYEKELGGRRSERPDRHGRAATTECEEPPQVGGGGRRSGQQARHPSLSERAGITGRQASPDADADWQDRNSAGRLADVGGQLCRR